MAVQQALVFSSFDGRRVGSSFSDQLRENEKKSQFYTNISPSRCYELTLFTVMDFIFVKWRVEASSREMMIDTPTSGDPPGGWDL